MLLCTNLLAALPRYEFTPKVKAAYDKVINLRFQEAKALIVQIKATDRDNYMVYYVENYIDVLTAFINENSSEYKRLKSNKDKRLDMLKKGDPSSPYYLFTQAQSRLYWAITGVKFGEYINAFTEVSKAYHLLEKNQELFPDFMPNKMSLGAMHAVIGTIPDNYKWGVKLLSGMDGTVQQGMSEIESVVRYSNTRPFEFEQEVLVMYAFLVLHLNNQSEKAWTLISTSNLNIKESPLASFALANVAMHTGRNDEAIRILMDRPNGKGYLPFPYLDFMLGCSKFYRMDPDASVFFKRFLTNFHGKYYIKEAYQKLAWQSLINSRIAEYKNYMQLCKTRGTASVGGDKNAYDEANSGQIPDVALLKARLLFDGGYYQRAYDYLKLKSPTDYREMRFKLEYAYRMGRITHLLKRTPDALKYYQQSIDLGKDEDYYFACNAALQMGNIYEDQGEKDRARQYYNICLDLDPDDYADGLHAKAKAGLLRMKKK